MIDWGVLGENRRTIITFHFSQLAAWAGPVSYVRRHIHINEKKKKNWLISWLMDNKLELILINERFSSFLKPFFMAWREYVKSI